MTFFSRASLTNNKIIPRLAGQPFVRMREVPGFLLSREVASCPSSSERPAIRLLDGGSPDHVQVRHLGTYG